MRDEAKVRIESEDESASEGGEDIGIMPRAMTVAML